jgi:L,D-peptidoglycan transpeptidase YkuD (ErfK/YbiS/YcfS/YnhG family)
MRRWTAAAVCGLVVAGTPAGPSPSAGAADEPVPAPAWVSCRVTLAGVAVIVGKSERTRTIVDGTSRHRAQLSFWVRDDSPCGFVQVVATKAWVGANGFSNGRTRHQGSLTTPTGTYSMTEAFGIQPNPGTALPYHQVEKGDWWVEDNTSRYYNSLRNERLGGFHPTRRGVNGSERLLDYHGQYAHVVVLNFNRPPDRRVHKRGAGIFLHVKSPKGATAGCISISKSELRLLMSYLQVGDRISIVR